MAQEFKTDDLCPHCGVPVPMTQRGSACPHCGLDFDLPSDSPSCRGYLTTFGHGVCGLIAGGYGGAVVALATDRQLTLDDPQVVLLPAMGGVLGAAAAAAVSSRLAVGVRRGYEAALFGFVIAVLCMFCLELLGPVPVDAVLAAGAVALAVAIPAIWRYLYGRRAGGTVRRAS